MVYKKDLISNCKDIERSLPAGKNKKVIGLMKDELGREKLKEFVASRPKMYSFLKDDDEKDKKGKGTEKCIIKHRLKFADYKACLEASQI